MTDRRALSGAESIKYRSGEEPRRRLFFRFFRRTICMGACAAIRVSTVDTVLSIEELTLGVSGPVADSLPFRRGLETFE